MEAKYKRVEAVPPDLDRFVSAQNIALYRRLLDTRTDETQRRAIFRLLADQVAALRDM